MNKIVTRAIVLSRTDFQEADRILTVLTPQHGKVRLIAKGVRKSQSKLAGGVEPLSVSDITYVIGRSEIGTLISARMYEHFSNILSDFDRTMFAYKLLKQVNKVTEESAEEAYFLLMLSVLRSLDDSTLVEDTIELWFIMHLLDMSGHSPNFKSDDGGKPLKSSRRYSFNYEAMAFTPDDDGGFDANRIKLLMLARAAREPQLLAKVQNLDELAPDALRVAQRMLKFSLNT